MIAPVGECQRAERRWIRIVDERPSDESSLRLGADEVRVPPLVVTSPARRPCCPPHQSFVVEEAPVVNLWQSNVLYFCTEKCSEEGKF